MGDPKFPRKKYETPNHPWKAERIQEEKDAQRSFGLKNKREIWKAKSLIRNFRKQARSLTARRRTGDLQAEKETDQLLKRLEVLGILQSGAGISDVLAISLEQVLNRRLQTVVHHMGLTNTPKQARQLIVHGHINIGERTVTIPGYIVRRLEEGEVQINPNSPFDSETHPMRVQGQKQEDMTGLGNEPPAEGTKEA
jgi:small subunit ribosomal protein S4